MNVSDYDKLPYGSFEDDRRGFRHSIDKLVVDFTLLPGFSFGDFLSSFLNESSFLFVSDRGEEGFNSYFDKPPSSHYSWFASAFWFPHVNVKFGAYNMKDWKDNTVEVKIKPLLRLEFNPNKVFQDGIFCTLIRCINRFFSVGTILEVDYAVDIPCLTSSVICQSRKSKVIYNDSRYYGKRHTHGRLKIYNKAREIHDKEHITLDGPLTRCEITLCLGCDFDPLNVFLCSGPLNGIKLSKNLQSIADLIILASSYGEDREELVYRFVPDKRNRDMLRPVLFGDKEIIFDFVRFYNLLVFYSDLYYLRFHFSGTLGKSYGFD